MSIDFNVSISNRKIWNLPDKETKTYKLNSIRFSWALLLIDGDLFNDRGQQLELVT